MLINDQNYLEIVNDIKTRIAEAQRGAVLSAMKELNILYWNIGKIVNEKNVWGSKFVDNLSRDIKLSFPKVQGYSPRNLRYMAKFNEIFPDFQILQRALQNLPWRTNIAIIDKIKNPDEMLWYAHEAAKNGWSRNLLVHQIELELYKRQVLAHKVTNFDLQLPPPQSELVEQAIKDPYIFEVVALKPLKHERDVEDALVQSVTNLLLEFGTGFAFIKNQYHIQVGEQDFYIDLLFYNLELRCYFVIELKSGNFDPRDAGQLNFYCSAIDGLLKKKHDNDTIGLLLCKDKDNMVAEYALRKINSPIGVAEYKIINKLPKELENVLPSAEDIKTRIKFE